MTEIPDYLKAQAYEAGRDALCSRIIEMGGFYSLHRSFSELDVDEAWNAHLDTFLPYLESAVTPEERVFNKIVNESAGINSLVQNANTLVEQGLSPKVAVDYITARALYIAAFGEQAMLEIERAS